MDSFSDYDSHRQACGCPSDHGPINTCNDKNCSGRVLQFNPFECRWIGIGPWDEDKQNKQDHRQDEQRVREAAARQAERQFAL